MALYKVIEGQSENMQCQACVRECYIAPDKTGFCGNRKNTVQRIEDCIPNNIVVIDTNGVLGDKPIKYFVKDENIVSCCTPVLSVGGYNCNLDCQECPNESMSHPHEKDVGSTEYFSPEMVIEMAKKQGLGFIALTYNEPVPFVDTTMELTRLASQAGIETILVTNSTCTTEFLDLYQESGGKIVRMDLKASLSSGNNFYEKYCNLKVVEEGEVVTIDKILESIKHAKEIGLHLELMSAITPFDYVPSNFPNEEEFQKTARWILGNLGAETPWHLALFRTKGKNVDIGANLSRVRDYVQLAKSVGLTRVGLVEKMCDCLEMEEFEEKE
ncbi:radical SAM protein [Candidatus Woesearchaeota archaeon]|jgi:pyruvate formate lyase activating enzyme|nr:radical SAM protein [Candidatus Woesearchaeota archaeon]MBT4110978.1 radical SAM protein [Candidatus Woesearchaeota archaeon]MBT4336847.1 radical SAM protein [Candidatus Woesearchaeota archaeon]MBT4469838.1 radical SAM protein [Candidatus Woesearchaeota archaeon]MBT6743691.1 radical SAM protein [Candidatus Woesearchaeota archaeon]